MCIIAAQHRKMMIRSYRTTLNSLPDDAPIRVFLLNRLPSQADHRKAFLTHREVHAPSNNHPYWLCLLLVEPGSFSGHTLGLSDSARFG